MASSDIHVINNSGNSGTDYDVLVDSKTIGGTTGSVQYVALVDATVGGTSLAVVSAAGIKVDLSGTAANATAVKVDGSAVTQPVSFTTPISVTQSGTWTVQQGGAPWSVSGSGTFTTQDSSSLVDNSAFTDGTSRVLPAGYIFDETAGTALTENDVAAARIDSKRATVGVLEDATTRGQRAAVSAAGRLSVDASGVAVPVTDNAGSLTVDAPVGTPVFVRLSDGSAALTVNSGALLVDTELPAAAAMADSTSETASVPEVGAALLVRNTGGTVGQQMNRASAVYNTMNIAGGTVLGAGMVAQFDDTSPTAVSENSFGPLRMSTNRNVYGTIRDAAGNERGVNVTAQNQLLVNPQPQTTGGLTINRLISAATTNATSVKASAGQVYSIYATNTNSAVRYLKLYNKASAPTVGVDTPVLTFAIPGNVAGAGFALDTGGLGIAFATGIAYATTTGATDADANAVAANEIIVNLLYT